MIYDSCTVLSHCNSHLMLPRHAFDVMNDRSDVVEYILAAWVIRYVHHSSICNDFITVGLDSVYANDFCEFLVKMIIHHLCWTTVRWEFKLKSWRYKQVTVAWIWIGSRSVRLLFKCLQRQTTMGDVLLFSLCYSLLHGWLDSCVMFHSYDSGFKVKSEIFGWQMIECRIEYFVISHTHVTCPMSIVHCPLSSVCIRCGNWANSFIYGSNRLYERIAKIYDSKLILHNTHAEVYVYFHATIYFCLDVRIDAATRTTNVHAVRCVFFFLFLHELFIR